MTVASHAHRQAKYRQQSLSRMNYRQALKWLTYHDDCQWVFNDGPIAVTAGFIGDSYGRNSEQVRADLAAMLGGSEESYVDWLADRALWNASCN